MPAAYCSICFSHLSIDKFVVFPCGHGFCIDCNSRMFQGSVRPNCPNCRLRICKRDAHPLFLELVDSKVAFALSLVDGLEKMDHETPLLGVKKAGQKLTEVLQDPQLEPNAMTERLIKATEDFNERIVPLFSKVEVQTQEIIALRKDFSESLQEIDKLRDQLGKAEIKSIQLEIELNKTKKNENEAICLAKIAKDDLGKVHESSLQWKKRASELSAENIHYKDVLERQKLEYFESARPQSERKNKLQKHVRHNVAAKEKETMSDAARDCDGDFSAHEHSMMRSSLNVMSTSSSRTAIRHPRDKIYIGQQEHFIEKIVDQRRSGRGFQYLVRWQGEGPEGDLWLPARHFEDSEAMNNWLARKG